MDKVSQNRKIALAAERSAQQATNAAAQADKSAIGQAISTANTALEVHGKVMGAYGSVMGATGALAEKAVVAVFSKLAFMQGIASLPASSQLDPVVGIDVHLVMIPPSPSPIPMPHPYVAMVFNPKDFIACAVMSVVAAIPPPPPDSAGKQLASTVGKMALGMVMAKMGLGASVKLGGFTPRTVTGTANKVVPHFPMGASFAPIPILKNSGHAQFGSLFLLADGEPFTGLMHLNNDCWDVGIMQLMRKKAPPEAMHLFMPTGFVMAIPSHNVIINPIPTPINPIAALTKLFNFGLAKLLHKIVNKLPKGLRAGLHKAVCHVTGHPVDVVSGMLFTDEEDFSLPGVIPLSWERTWYSDSAYKGPLGHGWYHNYDMAFVLDENNNQATFRMNDGRGVVFQLPQPGKFTFDRAEKLFLHRHPDEGFLYIADKDGLIYRFTDRLYKDQHNQLACHLLRSISNTSGFALRFEYDSSGLLIKIIDSAGRKLTLENDGEGRISNIIAPHPSELNSTFAIAHYDYDGGGNMTGQMDALGQQMLFEYTNHLLVKETWRNGHQWNFEYDVKANGGRCIHTWGDGDIYNHKLTYFEGCTIVENSLGHKTTYYHKNGLPSIKVDGNGAEWKYRHNRFNELEWETDPLGNQNNYSYDEWGNIASETNPDAGFTSTEYYNPRFPLLPTEELDISGGKWKWEYDENGDLSVETNPLGGRTLYKYTEGLFSEMKNALGAITKLVYDKAQNLAAIRTDDGATTEYLYDLLGNCTTVKNANGIQQKRKYDLKSRIMRIDDYDGNSILLDYDGIDNVTRYRDKHKDITYSYRGLWKLTSRTEAGATICFKYDTEEQLRKVINEVNLPYSFDLDPEGNVVQEEGFDGITREYERNRAGWITKMNKPAGRYIKYKYNKTGLVTETNYSDGSSENYQYSSDGSLISAVNENSVVQFEWDLMGNLILEKTNNEWISHEYNIAGKRTKTISSLGANIENQYNLIGNIEETNANGWLAKFEYNNLGFEIKRFLPNGLSSRCNRDDIGRPIEHVVERTEGGSFKQNRIRQYFWDVNDRLKQIKNSKGVIRYERDDFGNLSKSVLGNGEEQLRNSDVVGNLFRTVDHTDRSYIKGGQLKKSGGWEFEYDEEGNLIKKYKKNSKCSADPGEVWNYQWDETGMLTKVERPDKPEVTFVYDVLGRRISKRVKNTITKFVWDGNVPLHEWKEHVDSGVKLSNTNVDVDGIITWFFDNDSYAPAAKIKGQNTYTIITDFSGTPCQMYTNDGSLFWDCELDIYGKVMMEKGESGSCPFRYQGQYEDVETGLYYNRFRYYDPEEGIYLSQDPIGLTGSHSMYGYVHDPSTWVDVYGLSGEETLKPGPFAKDSIPARGPERDWRKDEVDKNNEHGRDGGCHTCGSKDPKTKSGNFILDHQPPSKLNPKKKPQRLYPHCLNCSNKQGGVVGGKLRKKPKKPKATKKPKKPGYKGKKKT
jgi:RHS repeat-associated protein